MKMLNASQKIITQEKLISRIRGIKTLTSSIPKLHENKPKKQTQMNRTENFKTQQTLKSEKNLFLIR